MTPEQELAERIVECGVGYRYFNNKKSNKYIIDNLIGRASFLSASEFIRDGRVMAAMMERCATIEIAVTENGWHVDVNDDGLNRVYHTQLPVAIITAICDALEIK